MTLIEFEDFFRAEYESVTRALVLALSDRALAEEAAQHGFVEAFAHWKRVRAMDRPAGWAYVAAVRHARRRRPALVADEVHGDVPDHADAVVEHHDIARLLDSLPPRQRLAVVLRYLADLPLEDVAGAMGCALGTAKSTLHAALSRMKVTIDVSAEAVDAHR